MGRQGGGYDCDDRSSVNEAQKETMFNVNRFLKTPEGFILSFTGCKLLI